MTCLFRNPVYKGEYVYGKTRGKVPANRDYQPSKKRPLQKAYIETAIKNRNFIPHEVVVVEVPAIIDPETWERAQALKKERWRRTYLTLGQHKYHYNFTGMVRCHHCGRVMMRTTITQKTKKKGTKLHPYYTCRNRENAGAGADIEKAAACVVFLNRVEAEASRFVCAGAERHARLDANY